MGRGNACVQGEYEGLFFIDWDNFSSEYEDEDGNVVTDDYELQRESFDDDMYMFKDSFIKRFKSFSKCDTWVDNESRAMLESSLFYIAVEDNEWSMAIKLIQKEQSCYDAGNIENLQKKHYQTYLDGMRDCLFELYSELGTYSGAWTSGKIQRDDFKKAS